MASNKNSISNPSPVEQWPEKMIPLADLKPYECNPRKVTPEAYERLKSKIMRFGYHGRIVATQDLKINPVAVLVAPRALTDAEYRELLISDNLQDGEWDTDMLASDFENDELASWGMKPDELPNFDPSSEEDSGRLGEIAEKENIICPKCQHEFHA